MLRHGRALISSSGNTPGIVQLTPPHRQGVKGSKAKQLGETAVSRDINRVYGGPSRLGNRIYAKSKGAAFAFSRAVKKKDWAKANEIAQAEVGQRLREFDDGTEHRRRRDKRGRVVGKVPSYYVAQKSNSKTQPAPWIRAYIKKKQALVGLLCAALIQSAEARLGGKLANVPEWVRRHVGKASGDAQTTLLESNTGFTVTARVSSPRAPAEMQRRMDYAAGYRLNAMKADLPRTAKRLEQRLQSGL